MTLQPRHVLSLLLVVVGGCADRPIDRAPERDPAPSGVEAPRLRIEPAEVEVTVVDGAAVVQGFQVTLVGRDGTARDVTAATTFAVADPEMGTWYGSALTVSGMRAGPTTVTASVEGAEARAQLIVRVHTRRVEDTAPTDAVAAFAAATTATGCAPQIAYPAHGVTVPPNLGPFEVQWTASAHDVFEIAITNEYIDHRTYTVGRDTPWTTVRISDMQLVASAGRPSSLRVTGLSTTAPGTKCASEPRTFETTHQDTFGGAYYWSTTVGSEATWQGVKRYDVMHPSVAPQRFEPDQNSCVGCHAVSRDGTRVSLTVDGAGGRGMVYDLVERRTMMPTDAGAPSWNASTFTPDGNKLLTVQGGVMKLLEVDGGGELATVPNTPGTISGSPEFSPDGRLVASVEIDSGTDWLFGDAAVVVRSFDDETNTFGAPVVVVPFDAQADLQSYYPSWSPDSRWLAFTRSHDGSSYANPDATVWVVKADGATPPVQVASTSGMTESAARWLPSTNTVGPAGEQVYFVSFSSMRAFGERLVDGERSQLWIAPFFPARAENGTVGPAFRASFQDLNNDNHSAQWAAEIVR